MAEPQHPPTHEYLFDVKLQAAFRLQAHTETEARLILDQALDCMDCNGGVWPPCAHNAGEPILFEASATGEFVLAEVDDEAMP